MVSTPEPSEQPTETPAAPVVTTTTEIVIVEAPTETTTLSITSTTTTAMSTAPPGPPANAADLKPFAADGKSVIVADTSSKDYREFKIKAGITNAGQSSAASITVNLNNTVNKVFTWKIEAVAAGENVILETTVGDIIKQATFTPGLKSLSIDIFVADSSQEIGGNNKSAPQDITIACGPAARRASQSTAEKMIQDSIDNATWYTSANLNELITIAKDVLKDARVQWSMANIEIKPFDDFSKIFSDSYGETEEQKKELKDWLEKNRLMGISIVYGTNANAKICLREGMLVQVLPVLFAKLGHISYSQANFAAYSTGFETGSVDLVEALIETYGFSILRDKYGFNGLTSMSVSIGSIPSLSLKNDPTLKRVWSDIGAAGYLNGDVPSADILKVYLALLMNPDPVSYIENLDKKGESLEISLIENIIRWRMVSSTIVILPWDAVQKLDPSKTSFSFDSLISYQDYVVLPW
jgi:hypothetical protein